MPHAPIQFDEGDSWEENRRLVQYELNRLAQNVHDLREETNALVVRSAEQRTKDLERLDGMLTANTLRVGVLEAKFILYAIIGGAIGMTLMRFVFEKVF